MFFHEFFPEEISEITMIMVIKSKFKSVWFENYKLQKCLKKNFSRKRLEIFAESHRSRIKKPFELLKI